MLEITAASIANATRRSFEKRCKVRPCSNKSIAVECANPRHRDRRAELAVIHDAPLPAPDTRTLAERADASVLMSPALPQPKRYRGIAI